MNNDKKAYAQREKAYMNGKLFPFIRVGMQKVNLTPTVNTECSRLHLRYQRTIQ